MKNEDMQQVIEQDKVESAAINEAIGKNPEIIQPYNTAVDANNESSSSTTAVTAPQELLEEYCSEESDIADQEEEEQQP